MAQVFDEKPDIVTVTIGGAEDSREYHVAGQSVEEVADIIRAALEALRSGKPKKARKPRRTKAEIAALCGEKIAPELEPQPEAKPKKERKLKNIFAEDKEPVAA